MLVLCHGLGRSLSSALCLLASTMMVKTFFDDLDLCLASSNDSASQLRRAAICIATNLKAVVISDISSIVSCNCYLIHAVTRSTT